MGDRFSLSPFFLSPTRATSFVLELQAAVTQLQAHPGMGRAGRVPVGFFHFWSLAVRGASWSWAGVEQYHVACGNAIFDRLRSREPHGINLDGS